MIVLAFLIPLAIFHIGLSVKACSSILVQDFSHETDIRFRKKKKEYMLKRFIIYTCLTFIFIVVAFVLYTLEELLGITLMPYNSFFAVGIAILGLLIVIINHFRIYLYFSKMKEKIVQDRETEKLTA